jgi:hypothetical protein
MTILRMALLGGVCWRRVSPSSALPVYLKGIANVGTQEAGGLGCHDLLKLSTQDAGLVASTLPMISSGANFQSFGVKPRLAASTVPAVKETRASSNARNEFASDVIVVLSKYAMLQDGSPNWIPENVSVHFRRKEDLDNWVRSCGCDFSQVVPAALWSTSTLTLEDLENHVTYVLESESRHPETARNHRMWTRIMDKVLEREAIVTVLRDAPEHFGGEALCEYQFAREPHSSLSTVITETREIDGHVYALREYPLAPGPRTLTAGGETREIDGLVYSSSIAFVVEAKHEGVPAHIDVVLDKRRFVQSLAASGKLPELASVSQFHAVLATDLLTPEVQASCKMAGVSVVHPTGARRLGFVLHSQL